jgi:hypothetical protein
MERTQVIREKLWGSHGQGLAGKRIPYSAVSQMLTHSYFLTISRDMTARLYTLDPVEGFKPKSFGGHRDVVLGAWFSDDEKTVSADCCMNLTSDIHRCPGRSSLYLER